MGNKKNFSFMNQVTLIKMYLLEKIQKIWHFSHVQSNASIGENCSIGQNVNVTK